MDKKYSYFQDRFINVIKSTDTEVAHAQADSLLVEALRNKENLSKSEVERIISFYDAVDKWYA